MIVFVTGTDTEVGKTVTTAALAAVALASGQSVCVIKPVQTGVGPDEAGDLEEVRRLTGVTDIREPARLRDPLAPDTAARVTGVTLPGICDQRDVVLNAAEDHDLVLVEGAGGIRVPIGEAWNLLDLATMVQERQPLAFVVVARAGLGTLNHSALTVDAITSRGQYVAGIVIGSWPGDPGLAENHNLDDLPRITGVPLLGRIPAGAPLLRPDRFRAQALRWFSSLPWDVTS